MKSVASLLMSDLQSLIMQYLKDLKFVIFMFSSNSAINQN